MASPQPIAIESAEWLSNDSKVAIANDSKVAIPFPPLKSESKPRVRVARTYSTLTTASSNVPDLSDGETGSLSSPSASGEPNALSDIPASPQLAPSIDAQMTDDNPININYSKEWRLQDEMAVRAPYEYVASLPQGGFRSQFLKACNIWFNVPKQHCQVIERVVGMLHNASLIIDDIQDGSKLRRGLPVTHTIYGVAQAINAANYIYFQAQNELMALPNHQDAVKVFEEELLWLHRGQGMELYWRDTLTQPTMDEYLQMVSNKTGGLFRLVLRLLQAVSGQFDQKLVEIVDVVGLIFQILDDYKNLLDCEMAAAKGYCEDLTEGKFSFPIVHALSQLGPNKELLNIIKMRTEDNAVKAYAVQRMEHETHSFEFTRRALNQLHRHARQLLANLGRPNPGFDLMLNKLSEKQKETWFVQENHSCSA